MIKKIFKITFVLINLLVIFSVMSIRVYAQGDRQHKIQAAFIYNFAKFITWPDGTFADSQSPLIIGVLGQDPLVEALSSIEGKIAQNRKIIIKQFNTEKDVDVCHILFISSSEQNRLNQIFNNGLSGKKFLTVGNMPQFTQNGGGINFIIKNH